MEGSSISRSFELLGIHPASERESWISFKVATHRNSVACKRLTTSKLLPADLSEILCENRKRRRSSEVQRLNASDSGARELRPVNSGAFRARKNDVLSEDENF